MPSRALVVSAAVVLACAGCGDNKPSSTTPDGGDAASPSDAADAPTTPDGGDAASPSDATDVSGDVVIVAPTLIAALSATIALPGVPVAAAYNAGTKKAYFACQTPTKASAGVAVVDDVTNAIVATITSAAPLTSLAANATTKTVYGAEGAQVDVIDSATDTISKTVMIPDGSTIAGLAGDEAHNRTYVVTTTPGGTELFVLDGATNMISSLRPPLLKPVGTPSVAVDDTTQKLFVLGVDSNNEGEIVTLDGPSGVPTSLATTNSMVDPSVSGVVPLGNGTATILFVKPAVVKGLEQRDITLPASFTPGGVAAADLGRGPITLVVGFGAGGALEGFGADTSTGALSPFGVPLDGGLPPNTTAALLLTAAPIPGGSEVYVSPTPDPKADASFSPTETIKITVMVVDLARED
jgi:hypothetical protein